ncbi:MAG: hypothetical protein JWP57_4727 [Spirosoma sp.]|nr:hypothetical protein [Spirosoma sp.]
MKRHRERVGGGASPETGRPPAATGPPVHALRQPAVVRSLRPEHPTTVGPALAPPAPSALPERRELSCPRTSKNGPVPQRRMWRGRSGPQRPDPQLDTPIGCCPPGIARPSEYRVKVRKVDAGDTDRPPLRGGTGHERCRPTGSGRHFPENQKERPDPGPHHSGHDRR